MQLGGECFCRDQWSGTCCSRHCCFQPRRNEPMVLRRMRALAVCLMIGVALMLGGCGTPSDKCAAKEACQREYAEQIADCQATNCRHC